MDKNTIIGLVLMFFVIVGFTWLTSPSEEELAQQRAEQQKREQVQAKNEAKSDVVADTLTLNDLGLIKSSIKQYGRVEDGATVLTANGVSLTLNGEELTGKIQLAGKTVDFSETTSTADVKTRNAAIAAVRDAVSNYSKSGEFAKCLTGENKTVTLKNDVLQLDIATKGGGIAKATLLQYKTYKTPVVELFNSDINKFGFVLNTHSQRFDTGDYYFTPVAQNDSSVTMQLNLGEGSTWAVRYTLEQGSYMVKMEVLQENMSRIIPQNIPTMDIYWTQKMPRQEEGKMFEERNSGVYFKYAKGDVDYLNETSSKEEKETQEQVKWVSFKNQFFSNVLIADTYMTGAQMTSEAIDKDSSFYGDYLKNLTLNTAVEYNSASKTPVSFQLFFGPNKYSLLKDYNKYCADEELDLNRLVPLGWALFRGINTWIVIPVFDFLCRYVGNLGVVILLLTLLLKLALFPLANKSYVSQAKMRFLAPDIKEINDKYPGQENAMKRQQKTMALYSLAGASPFGGCIPMLLQMPFLIAMFTFFPSCIELRGESFLWAKDLSAPDVIFSWTAQIPIITNYFGNHVSLFCLLMTATNIMYTRLNMQTQASSNQMPGMKWMMYLMPLMFLVFFNNYASGLSYYYFISLLFTILQSYGTRYFVKESKMRALMAVNAKKPQKKSGFLARMEEAQRQQEQMRKAKQNKRR